MKPTCKSGTFAVDTKQVAQKAAASTWTDEELLAQMTSSSPESVSVAWREFQLRYDRLVHRCILKVTRRFSSVVSQEDVREIAATLQLSLLANDMHKLKSFDPTRGNRFSSWIGLLAINCAYDYLRGLRREPGRACLSEASDLACELPDPFEAVSQRQRASIAAEMLQGFSERDRTFASLYFGEGMDPAAIAEEMNISVKTVYSKKHKIQARLELAAKSAAA